VSLDEILSSALATLVATTRALLAIIGRRAGADIRCTEEPLSLLGVADAVDGNKQSRSGAEVSVSGAAALEQPGEGSSGTKRCL
jgi:hypothetical protein